MDHITTASASAPLSQYGTETRMDIQKEAYWPKSWYCPNKEDRYFYVFLYISHLEHTIWEILSKVYESTWTNKKQILRWDLPLERKWWFFTIQKNSSVCREWQSIPGGEIPLAQYCAEIGLQCGRPGFNPCVGKIPWRRAWQPSPVFLPAESP